MLLATIETMELADGVRRGGEHGGGGFFLFPLFLLLALGGLGWWWFGRRGGGGAAVSRGAALGVLDDRFARGEITREEFEYRRAVLKRDKNVPPAPRASSSGSDPTPPSTGPAGGRPAPGGTTPPSTGPTDPGPGDDPAS